MLIGRYRELVLVVGLLSAASWAHTVTQAATIPLEATTGAVSFDLLPRQIIGTTTRVVDPASINFQFPRFDPALGELTGVSVRYFVTGAASVSGLASGQFAGINTNLRINHALDVPGDPAGSTAFEDFLFFNDSFSGPGPFGANPLRAERDTFDTGLVPLPVQANSLYVGSGSIPVPLNLEFVQEGTKSSGEAFFEFGAATSTTVQLVYTFVVPEPASLSGLLLLAGVGLGFSRHR